MKIRDTAASHEGRAAAGAWLAKLREESGLSQSELAAKLDEPHYTFISQLETGRRSIPTYQIERLAEALFISPHDFAKTLLSHQDPFTYACLFGTSKDYEHALERTLMPRPQTDRGLDEAITSQVTFDAEGESAGALRKKVEGHIGREVHHQSVAQALRRLQGEGRVRRVGRNWARIEA